MDLKFDFFYETKTYDSFRVKSLIGAYDLENKKTIQHFKGNYKLPEKWNIGLIVGNSGTGKTSIYKNVFGDFKKCLFDEKPIIENFSSNYSMDEITYVLGNVGFNSVPYWLKPFNVLSNGEKSRVELAKLILEENFFGYDEFTSMVDRDVAKAMSHSIQKTVRKLNKQSVFVSCHKDIIEWLNPDWVYDTDLQEFFFIQSKEQKNLILNYKKLTENNGNFIKNFII